MMSNSNIMQLTLKTPLWLVFLPFSPLVIIIYIMNKWRNHHLTGFNKHWNRTTFTIVLFTTLFGFCTCSPVLMCVKKSNSILMLIAATYLCCVCISLFIRAVEHWNAKKTYSEIRK